MASPLIVLVTSAVAVGVLGTLFTIIALSVNSWEYISFDNNILAKYSTVNASTEYFSILASSDSDFAILNQQVFSASSDNMTALVKYYLYSTYTGVWRICDRLSDSARVSLEGLRSTSINECYIFVTEYDEENDDLPDWMKSIGRMQNSAASCFIVTMIDLVAAAAVGTFAIIKKQVSACMVTGVLYCMAGLFSIFGLTIFHTKMYYEKYQCYSFDENKLPSAACEARVVSIGWAIPLAWVGVIVCVIAFGLWIFVTRAFRVIKSKTML